MTKFNKTIATLKQVGAFLDVIGYNSEEFKQNVQDSLKEINQGQTLPIDSVRDCTMTKHHTLGWVKEVRMYECPSCLNNNLPELATFCPDCGGRFDWEDKTV